MPGSTFATAFAGAVFGGLVTLSVNIVKMRLDTFASRCDRLADLIGEAADAASEYWLMKVSSDEDWITPDNVEDFEKAKFLETRIIGLQEQILLLADRLKPELPEDSRATITAVLPEFVSSLSGAAFMARAGDRNYADASLVQAGGANLIAAILDGAQQRQTITYILKRLRRRH
jgi:hypothetical protein